MKGFLENFKLGKLCLSNNLFCAPLAGCSDYPFRQIASFFRPGLTFCEMVKIEALTRHEPATYRMLDYDSSMHPVGAQICGSNPKIAKRAARIIEDLGFDVIDFNCGCPVDKVTKDGSGSAMLLQLEKMGEILSEIKSSVSIPVTIKIRSGWDDQHICVEEVVSIAEKVNIDAITIHGRTRKQGYRGKANWDFIKRGKDHAKKILVFGNGDVFNVQAAEEMFSFTGCDGIVLARGILGQPWLLEDIVRKSKNLEIFEKTPLEIGTVLLKHFDFIFDYQNEKRVLFDMRRVGCWYLKNFSGTKALRVALNQAKTSEEAYQLIQKYPWEKISCEKEVSSPEESFCCES